MAPDGTIYLVIGARTYYFPGCNIVRQLNKNLIVFKLYKENKAKDLLRVTDSFTITGTWFDDTESEYDNLIAFQRYLNFKAQIKKGSTSSNLGPLCYLIWGSRTYKTRVKSSEFSKESGHGFQMKYDITLLKVTS